MSKKIRSISLILVFLGLLATYLAGSFLTKTHPSTIGLAPSELPVVDVSFQSKSGSLLSGWYVEGNKQQGGVLLMHGIKANRLQMLARAKFLYNAGYSVLLFDFQGHGKSLGEQVTFGYLEALDAEAAYAFLHNKLQHKSIGVIGVSLGGASALLGSVAKQAQAVVLESVYPTIEEAISNRLVMYLGSLGQYLLPLLTVQMQPRLDFGTKDLQPIEHITQVTGSVFIIAGAEDKHTTLTESKRLFAQANQPKQMWVVDGAGHISFDRVRPEEYEAKVLAFFKGAL